MYMTGCTHGMLTAHLKPISICCQCYTVLNLGEHVAAMRIANHLTMCTQFDTTSRRDDSSADRCMSLRMLGSQELCMIQSAVLYLIGQKSLFCLYSIYRHTLQWYSLVHRRVQFCACFCAKAYVRCCQLVRMGLPPQSLART